MKSILKRDGRIAPFEEGKIDSKKKIDYAFLGAWNHFKEISKYQEWYTKSGGHWITHVPKPRVI